MSKLFVTNLVAMAVTLGGLGACVIGLHGLERLTSRLVAHHWGWRGVLITGWLGVPLHELSHLVSAWIFGHRIVDWSLFDPDPATGTLGYVRHAHRQRSAWQILGNFWIGVAPALAGAAALAALVAWMAPHLTMRQATDVVDTTHAGLPSVLALAQNTVHLVGELAVAIWRERTLWLPLQLYLAIAVACHMAPSIPDLQAATSGALVLLVLVVVLCALAALAQVTLAHALLVLPLALLVVAVVAVFHGLWALVVRCTA